MTRIISRPPTLIAAPLSKMGTNPQEFIIFSVVNQSVYLVPKPPVHYAKLHARRYRIWRIAAEAGLRLGTAHVGDRTEHAIRIYI